MAALLGGREMDCWAEARGKTVTLLRERGTTLKGGRKENDERLHSALEASALIYAALSSVVPV